MYILNNKVNNINGDIMKKIVLLISIIFLITACDLGNTPISIVEDYLNKYQMLDKSIDTSYTLLTRDNNITKDEKEEYEKIIKKQYRNLSYELKEETIDGNTATVPVEIEVMNFKKTIDKYTNNNKKIIEELKNNKEKITYTIKFKLTKKNNKWILNSLDNEEKLKLLGMK